MVADESIVWGLIKFLVIGLARFARGSNQVRPLHQGE